MDLFWAVFWAVFWIGALVLAITAAALIDWWVEGPPETQDDEEQDAI